MDIELGFADGFFGIVELPRLRKMGDIAAPPKQTSAPLTISEFETERCCRRCSNLGNRGGMPFGQNGGPHPECGQAKKNGRYARPRG
jgi:hypothetical protein